MMSDAAAAAAAVRENELPTIPTNIVASLDGS